MVFSFKSKSSDFSNPNDRMLLRMNAKVGINRKRVYIVNRKKDYDDSW